MIWQQAPGINSQATITIELTTIPRNLSFVRRSYRLCDGVHSRLPKSNTDEFLAGRDAEVNATADDERGEALVLGLALGVTSLSSCT